MRNEGYKTEKSKELFEIATRNIAGGVGSIARSVGAGFTPYPIFMDHGEGSHIFDVDGNEYIDYILAFGPLLLGHKPKAIFDSVFDTVQKRGSMLGLAHPLEWEVAELIKSAVPSIDLVRFGNSGTEVDMSAIRLARAFTGKEKIIRFEGHYHGWSDMLHFSASPPLSPPGVAGLEEFPNTVFQTPGTPKCLADTIIIQPWNRPEILERTIKRRKDEIAAIITEPVMGNCGCIPPNEGYLQFLREITEKNDILLIFDEVITGFRLSYGGAQGYYNIKPDLTTFAKALGAGFPIAAFGGRGDIMKLIAENKVHHSGTYNTNLVVMAAAKAVLKELSNPDVYKKLFDTAEQVKKGIEKILNDNGIPVICQGVGPMWQFWFSERPITNYREAIQYADADLYHKFYLEMIKKGVYFHPNQLENWFISTVHTREDVEETLNRTEDAVKELKKKI
ncbi:MAG TPA: aminotransferase class III-fold pyridoxal phosphate-dependent enzyme [Candidatus Marinimicrobia bacterium]|nr:aminotransferase class III-fold pyridoxal phosphate-dependent enzyme [Candidatus Neomarinimicrobiota bacterium]